MKNHLQELLVALSGAGVRYVVCGGVAVALHGVERMTLDLDLSVEMTGKNLQLFLDVMAVQQMQPRVPVAPEVILDPEKRKIIIEEKNARVFTFVDSKRPYRQVDIFLVNRFQYADLLKDAEIIEINGNTVYIASVSKLIEMKRDVQPLREKDSLDIKHLEQLRKERK